MVLDPSPAPSLQRSISQQSSLSVRSQRSATVRPNRSRKTSHARSAASASASSIAASDKSLTSFPSFSPESPRAERPDAFETPDLPRGPARPAPRVPSDGSSGAVPASSTSTRTLVSDLVGTGPSPHKSRTALFDDNPVAAQNVPGALHLADDAHIQRLISRHGALGLVRQMASDLAQRDAQMAAARRRADTRERALRKIILECGLSTMELETRLRGIEADMRAAEGRGVAAGGRTGENHLTDLMSDAMQDTVSFNAYGTTTSAIDATIRASSLSLNQDSNKGGTSRGWKEFFWGTGTSKRTSRASSASGEAPPRAPKAQAALERRPPLQEDLFNPPAAPDSASLQSSSRASSVAPQAGDRKGSTSFASMALRLVAGGSVAAREGAGDRGRTGSDSAVNTETSRTASRASGRTTQSSRTASTQGGPRALMAMRRNASVAAASAVARTQQQDRRDGITGSPPSGRGAGTQQESYGPVEMDTILAPEEQPPTLAHTYNNYGASEYLTDRFGFIYDQRRKKRQREAARMSRYVTNNRAEMITNGRDSISPTPIDEQPISPRWDAASASDDRPGSPSSSSLEEPAAEEGRPPKKWQDYLKIATFPTELLAHMPAMSAPSLEVLEAAETASSKPPSTGGGLITTGDRGFVPAARSTAALDSDASPAVPETSEPTAAAAAIVKEDTEPVRLLLQQLNDVHDSLQREKTVRWNDFLRKVRAERRREGEAAAAAAAAAAEARFERPAVILPEAKLADGEMIGISGLGNKGKVGRAKWNEFKALVLGGIPVTYRSKVWSECSGASAMRVPGYYEDLVSEGGRDDDDPTVVSQIEMDIHRTLTDNIFFRRGPGVQRLSEVLLAYARRNPEVGYCQGMNLITANLLLVMPSAEDAFWVLASIVENILPRGYYDHHLLASRADQQVLRRYVAEVLPRLSQHLDALGVELEALTFQWFLSVFTDCLSAEALFRVWDVVLCSSEGEGSAFLFRVALALLKLNETQLLGCEGPASVYTYINHQMTNHAISIDGLIGAGEGLRRVVRREDVEARREEAVKAEREVMRAREEARAAGGSVGKTKPVAGEASGSTSADTLTAVEATTATDGV